MCYNKSSCLCSTKPKQKSITCNMRNKQKRSCKEKNEYLKHEISPEHFQNIGEIIYLFSIINFKNNIILIYIYICIFYLEIICFYYKSENKIKTFYN